MASASKPVPLSSRETEILGLLAHGQTCRGVSNELQIAQSTVVTYVERMKNKCGARNIAELIHIMTKQEII